MKSFDREYIGSEPEKPWMQKFKWEGLLNVFRRGTYVEKYLRKIPPS
jgi:hypothetical protein